MPQGPIREGLIGSVLADNALILAKSGILGRAIEAATESIKDPVQRARMSGNYGEGWAAVQLGSNGQLRVSLQTGETSHDDPVAFQFIDADTGRVVSTQSYDWGMWRCEVSTAVDVESDGVSLAPFTDTDRLICRMLGDKVLSVLDADKASVVPNTLGV